MYPSNVDHVLLIVYHAIKIFIEGRGQVITNGLRGAPPKAVANIAEQLCAAVLVDEV